MKTELEIEIYQINGNRWEAMTIVSGRLFQATEYTRQEAIDKVIQRAKSFERIIVTV